MSIQLNPTNRDVRIIVDGNNNVSRREVLSNPSVLLRPRRQRHRQREKVLFCLSSNNRYDVHRSPRENPLNQLTRQCYVFRLAKKSKGRKLLLARIIIRKEE